MKTPRILLGLALLSVLAIPLVAAAAHGRHDRENRGESRIIIHGADGSVVLDEMDIEQLLEGLDALGPQIEEAIQEALEGLEEIDFDFDFGDRHGFVVNWDDQDWDDEEWAEWSERFGERMAAMSERLSERMERAGRDGWHVRRVDSDEREELQDQIRELQREIRRLTRELDDLRSDGEG